MKLKKLTFKDSKLTIYLEDQDHWFILRDFLSHYIEVPEIKVDTVRKPLDVNPLTPWNALQVISQTFDVALKTK